MKAEGRPTIFTTEYTEVTENRIESMVKNKDPRIIIVAQPLLQKPLRGLCVLCALRGEKFEVVSKVLEIVVTYCRARCYTHPPVLYQRNLL